MFGTLLYVVYYAVALFYLLFGVLLLTHPHLSEKRLKKCFPLLASYKYQRIANSINLTSIGAGLLIIGNMIKLDVFAGFLFALILSALEVYLGIMFYYIEERDMTQAVIHVVLHILIVFLIGIFILQHYSHQIYTMQHETATMIKAFFPWKI